MSSLQNEKVQNTLDKLFKEANKDTSKFAKLSLLSKKTRRTPEDMANLYLAVTPDQGNFLYVLARMNKAKNIVEFGTSFGISTIFLAAAAKDNGGNVIASELIAEKCMEARKNFASAGLSDFIELREGDALTTLKTISSQIDFLLLDGWKDLYLPIFKMLEKKLSNNAVIYVDNTDFAEVQDLLEYIKAKKSKYISVPIFDEKGRAEVVYKL